jgi:hypothetical protein
LNFFLQLTDGLAVVAFHSILHAIVTPAVTRAAKLGWDGEIPDADKENRDEQWHASFHTPYVVIVGVAIIVKSRWRTLRRRLFELDKKARWSGNFGGIELVVYELICTQSRYGLQW